MMTVVFEKAAGVVIWNLLGLFGVKHKCQACHQHIKPSTLGAAQKMKGGRVGLWHSNLTCMINFKNKELELNNSEETARNGERREH